MKFALIKLDREKGPSFIDNKNVKDNERNNILLFALPTGEARDGSFKLTTLRENFYISFIRIGENDVGKAAVIGINIEDEVLNFNPFALFEHLKTMIDTDEIPSIDPDSISTDVYKSPYSSNLEGGEYIMSAMFLLRRLIVVGNHEQIIKFLGTLYEATPFYSIPYLSCVTLVKSITEKINIQGVEMNEEIYPQLDDARRDSTIVMLDELQAFGTVSSPFTKKIAGLYLEGKFEESKDLIREFIGLISGNTIESAADFAVEHGIPKADAKLLKSLQSRTEELREARRNDVYYQGVE